VENFTKWGGGSLTLANGINLNGTNQTGTTQAPTNSGTITVERGTLSLGANANFYTGNVQVGSNNGGVGTLKLVANNVFAAVPQLQNGNVVDVYNGSKIDLNGFSDTLRIVRGMGGIVNTGGPGANL